MRNKRNLCRTVCKFLALAALSLAASGCRLVDRHMCEQATGVYSVLNYGAKGNGKADDTSAIQRAVDACAAAGGGRVLLPAGRVYLSGSIQLRANLDFHVAASARLLAIAEPEAYGQPRAFLHAKGADYLTVSGGGVIDGDGQAWMTHLEEDIFRPKPDRPGMIYFENCDHFSMREVTLRDAAAWTVHLTGCEDVLIEGIRILNDLRIPNCDGIDPNHCRNVRIANCHIEAGDDCIVPKNTQDMKHYGPTENITVTGCTLISTSCAIKIGTESVGDFRNLVFDSCVISGSNRGLGIQLRDSGTVENVLFSNMTIETGLHGPRWWGKAEPIYVTAIPRTAETQLGNIRNVRFSNIICRGESGVFVQGWQGDHIEGLVFDNVRVELDKQSEWPGGFRDARPGIGKGVYESRISAIYCEKAKDVAFRHCRVTWGDNTQDHFGAAFEAHDVEGLVLDDFVGQAAHPDRDSDRIINQ